MPTLKEIQEYIGDEFVAELGYHSKLNQYVIAFRPSDYSKNVTVPWNEEFGELTQFKFYKDRVIDPAIAQLKKVNFK